jgi:hypothetical protein
MADLQVAFTAEERKFLTDLLEEILKERRVEEHRTRTPSYREYVIHDEALISSVLRKVKPSAK